MSSTDMLLEGLKISGIGLATVFIVLTIFFVLIALMKKVFKGKAKEEDK